MASQGKGFGFLFEMGCGKTLTAIAVAGAGYQMGKVKRVLIVAPTSVCAVWPKEFQEYAAFPYTIKTMLGSKAQRLKELSDLVRFPYPHLKVAVINYESTWSQTKASGSRPTTPNRAKPFTAWGTRPDTR